jgi:hypothetical protein
MILRTKKNKWVMLIGLSALVGVLRGQESDKPKSSYMPVVVEGDFAATVTRMKAAKPELARKHMALLEARYDLSNRPAQGVTMFRGKPIQTGVRAKLTSGITWDSLGQMTPEEVLEKNGFPEGFLPLPHANGFPQIPH